MISIVIADDHLIFRDGLKLFIKKNKELVLVGEASNGQQLVDIVKSTRPDIILTDIKMPEKDGIEAVKEILIFFPEAKIIAFSMFDEEALVQEMFEAGAKGYLLKDAEKDEITEALELVLHGKPCFSRSFSTKLIHLLARSNYNPFSKKEIPLTEKEMEVIECMKDDLSSKEIAERLDLSTRTVEWYKMRLMEKMDVKSSTGVVVYAIKNNLVKL